MASADTVEKAWVITRHLGTVELTSQRHSRGSLICRYEHKGQFICIINKFLYIDVLSQKIYILDSVMVCIIL